MFSILVRFHVVLERRRVGDQLRLGLHDGVDDAQPVGAERRSGLGDFDDGVGEHRRLDLGRAPGELDVDADAGRAKYACVARTSSVAIVAPSRSCGV